MKSYFFVAASSFEMRLLRAAKLGWEEAKGAMAPTTVSKMFARRPTELCCLDMLEALRILKIHPVGCHGEFLYAKTVPLGMRISIRFHTVTRNNKHGRSHGSKGAWK